MRMKSLFYNFKFFYWIEYKRKRVLKYENIYRHLINDLVSTAFNQNPKRLGIEIFLEKKRNGYLDYNLERNDKDLEKEISDEAEHWFF